MATWLKKSVFIPIPKKGNAKVCSNHHTITFISHVNKVMLRILQYTLQWNVNWEVPDVQAGFRKGRGTRDQIVNIHWIIEKAREFRKNIYFCFIDYTKTFDCVDHNKLWKILKKWEYQTNYLPPEKPVCRSRNNSYKRTWNNRLDQNWEKSVSKLQIVTLLFNLYAEYVMWNAGLNESQARIKIAGRNISNPRYADDTTLTAES